MFKQHFILASNSPRRLELLKRAGITPDLVIPTNIDEAQQKKERSLEYVKRMSLQKVMEVKSLHEDSYILAADTIVVKGIKILGKAQNREQAKDFLELLSGCNHSVLTAFTVVSPDNKIITKALKTKVTLKRLSNSEINRYLDTNEWQDKAGAYAIQGVFEMFVKQINGSFSNIVGLPMMSVYNTLVGLGYKINF